MGSEKELGISHGHYGTILLDQDRRRNLMNPIINANRSLIVSADLPGEAEVHKLALDLEMLSIGAYKVGLVSALTSGLDSVCSAIRDAVGIQMPIIYDHQKAGTDIPEIGEPFAKVLLQAEVDAAILFPHAGPITEETWIKACQDQGLSVIVGLAMTHKEFLSSEGGYITDDAPARAFELACKLGIRDFVVPGTKPELVIALRAVLEREVGEGNYCLYAPGFISQGGDVTECGKVAGPNFHAIVGSGIYKQPTPEARRNAAQQIIDGLAKIE